MSPGCSALLGQPSWTETLRTPAPHGSRRAQHSLGGGPPPRPPKPQPGLQRLPEHQHITLITAPASSTFHPDGSSRPSLAFLLPSLRPLLPACLPTLGHPTGAAPTPRRLPRRSAPWSLRRVHKQPRPRHPCQLLCAPPSPQHTRPGLSASWSAGPGVTATSTPPALSGCPEQPAAFFAGSGVHPPHPGRCSQFSQLDFSPPDRRLCLTLFYLALPRLLALPSLPRVFTGYSALFFPSELLVHFFGLFFSGLFIYFLLV